VLLLVVIFAIAFGIFNVGDFLEQSSPYGWALTGIALNIGLSVMGAGQQLRMSNAQV
jgi:V-type H+-transporting ATPase proteolipid subunit